MAVGSSSRGTAVLLACLLVVAAFDQYGVSAQNVVTCLSRPSRCFLKRLRCPVECPLTRPANPTAKACYLDCSKCEVLCRGRKPRCNGLGSGCYDPRFIGGDGAVFYFHGKREESFSLVSDPNLQINARFTGLRPAGRKRDFTWIQALGLLFSSHAFTVAASPASVWDESRDHLRFTYDRAPPFQVPEGHLSTWKSPDGKLAVERTGGRNSVTVTLEGVAEMAVSVVPVTREDDRVHGYGIPSDDCFPHLEVQLRFLQGLSRGVEGVLGRTYRPNFQSPAKAGVAMAVVGGEDKYRTSSLLSSDCATCVFSPVAGA